MDSCEVLKKAIEAIGAKQVAHELGLSASMIYKWCEPPSKQWDDDQSGARNPLDRIAGIIRVTGDNAAVEWLCNMAGGFFVPNPEPAEAEPLDIEVLRHVQGLTKEFADVLSEVTSALSNDKWIDEKEARKIRKEWEELKSIAEGFVVACEKGAYAESDEKADDA